MTALVDQSRTESPLFDEAGLQQWTDDLTVDQVREILAKVPQDCNAAVAEIGAAIAAKDVATARRLAHRLKGMAANLGAAKLADAARAIELGADRAAEHVVRLERLRTIIGETNAAIVDLCDSL